MRLSHKVLNAITDSFKQVVLVPFELYLFGSRTDDSKKGGDIDLLVVTKHKDDVVKLKSAIRKKIFEHIPEQKIDITVATSVEISTDEFLKTIFPSAIKIL